MREVDRYKCQNITALKRAGQQQVGRVVLVYRRLGHDLDFEFKCQPAGAGSGAPKQGCMANSADHAEEAVASATLVRVLQAAKGPSGEFVAQQRLYSKALGVLVHLHYMQLGSPSMRTALLDIHSNVLGAILVCMPDFLRYTTVNNDVPSSPAA